MQLGLLPKPGTLGEKALLALRGFGLSLAGERDAVTSGGETTSGTDPVPG